MRLPSVVQPSSSISRASMRSPSPLRVAKAPKGVLQSPPTASMQARSASAKRRASLSSSGASSARVSASSLRAWMPRMPWLGAGSETSTPSRSQWRPSRSPRRLRPASASTTASRPSSPESLERRVPTLPRMPTIERSARWRSSCMLRRMEPVPMRAPGGSVASVSPGCRNTITSKGSARVGKASSTSPSGCAPGMSLRLWTAKSMRPSSIASSSSLMKSPLPPISMSGRSSTRSPSVLMTTRSMVSPGCAASSSSVMWSACQSASGLPRVPSRRSCFILPALLRS